MTNSIDDIENAGLILAIGSNTTEAHPIIALRIKKAVVENGCRLIVADPRHIRLCYIADQWLQLKPGSDIAFINAMMSVIIEEELYDKDFIAERTEGFEEQVEFIKKYTPESTAETTGLDPEEVRKAARLFATTEPAAIVYCLGITEHITGVDNVISLASLSMLTGNIGKPGGGVNPLRGQNNVQGACDMGALPNVYSGYQAVADAEARAKFEKAWGVKLPEKQGLTATDMMHMTGKGPIKALYIFGENLVLSDPNSNHVIESLKSVDFLVVEDIFLTETAELADVVLPAACFAEKEGTFTATDRRVQRVRKAVEPPGEAKPDFEIIGEISRRMGYEMATVEPAAVMDEVASLTPSYGGISHARLDTGVTLHWPCPDAEHPGTPILHTQFFTRGKGWFCPVDYVPPGEVPDEEYPLALSTGRLLWQYHTGTMTRRSRAIDEIDPHGKVWLSPQDAEEYGVVHGADAIVSTRRGSVELEAAVTERMPKGMLWMVFHYAESPTNVLTSSIVDPTSKTPEYKFCAARIEAKPNGHKR